MITAERHVLGVAQLGRDAWSLLEPLDIQPSDFRHPTHAVLWGAALRIYQGGTLPDATTILLALDDLDRRRAEGIGGAVYLGECMGGIVAPDNVAFYVSAMRESRRQQLVREGLGRAQLAADRGDVDDARESVRLLLEATEPLPREVRLPALAADAARYEWARSLPPPLSTGLAPLDKALNGGFYPESVYVLAAPQKRGKTGLVLQLARSLSLLAPVLYLTSELTRRQALARIAAQRNRASWLSLYMLDSSAGDIVENALRGLDLRAERLGPAEDPCELADRVAQKVGRAPVMVLDYLQHAARRARPDDMRLATSALSDTITRWTASARTVSLLVSSVSRAWTGDKDRDRSGRELEGAAKESGDVDYDAGGLLYLETEPCPIGGMAPARLHVVNHRFGGDGHAVGLAFEGAVGLFHPDATAELSEDEQGVLQAIRSGASSAEEIAGIMKKRKGVILVILRTLAAKNLIDRIPLRIREQSQGDA